MITPSRNSPAVSSLRSCTFGLSLRAVALFFLTGSVVWVRGQTTVWTATGTGDFLTGGNWSAGVPTSATNTFITNGTSGTPTVVNLAGTGNVASLEVDAFNMLNVNGGVLNVYGTQVTNGGAINVNGGGGANAFLVLVNNVTLQGGGTVTLSTATGGGNAFIEQAVGGLTLTNVNNTIQGSGIIGQNGLTLVNQATINANSTGGGQVPYLILQGLSGLTNTGLLEATNSGVLGINGVAVNNTGGNITANGAGATVQLYGGTQIQGGTLTNNGGAFFGTPSGNTAVLDGSTGAGAVTINGTYTSDLNSATYLLGTINNLGNLQVNGGNGTNTQLVVDSSNVTLQGGGTVTLSTATGGGNAFIEQAAGGLILTNVDNTIQGSGIIGQNGLTLVNHSTIDANSTGGGQVPYLILQGLSGLTNTGLLEATNSGVLGINGVPVNNTGGNITANGAGATVQLYGGTQIEGGTLNNNAGAFFGTPTGNTALLDGSTGAGAVTLNGTYTSDLNSATYLLGTINNLGNIQVNGGNGTNTQLEVDSSNVTLQGGGTVTLSTATGGGNAFIDQATGGLTLTNVDNTIQGSGIIGQNGLTLVNHSTIDANSTGGGQAPYLILQGLSGLTNTGLLEATNSGVLGINGVPVNNAGGNITANGAGATVQLYGGTEIQGGTLNNNGGAFFGTPTGNTALLDGSTGAGAVTLNGTFTSDLVSATYLLGTINNQGNIQVNGGSGTNTQLVVDSSNVTLQGGGTVTLSTALGGGNAFIEQAAGGLTLTNVNNTVQGSGIIGQNGLTLVNQATIDANSTGGGQVPYLILQGLSGLTNTGLLEATNSGALEINGVVVNNAGGNITANGASATVLLRGGTQIQGGTLNNNGGTFFGTPTGNTTFLDGSTGSGAVTINGTYTGDLDSETFTRGTINNQGNLQLNGGSGNNTFLVLAANTSLQGGGTVTMNVAGGGGTTYLEQAVGGLTLTNVDNTIQGAGVIGNNGLGLDNQAAGTVLANAPGQTLTVSIANVANSGTVQVDAGSAMQIVGNLTNDGRVVLGADLLHAGIISETGNYLQNSDGILMELISASYNGRFDVTGDITLDGIINVDLLDGFMPLVGQIFTVMTFTGTETGTFAGGVTGSEADAWTVLYNPGNNHEVDLEFLGTTGGGGGGGGETVPEPSAWMDIVFMVSLALFAPFIRTKARAAARAAD